MDSFRRCAQHRTVARNVVDDLHRIAAFDPDQLPFDRSLLQLTAEQIASGPRIEPFDIEILHIELEVRNAPCDAVVVADDDGWSARQRYSRHIQPGGLQVDHVPRRREVPLNVGIVRKNRLSADSVLPADDPGVRPGLEFEAGTRGKSSAAS